ncbi:KAP family P-loop domain-containing protein [Granulicatella balaenopterae]|uniref:KAP family P-loop domain-containing protein n=1 Tax=Granulicatella balaenopterae TaxID=137733 RepID=A0A1H9LVE8_9LACT|nr:P-loop NTPase fold protein [Granulicatella balaenopterae]SER15462.1 KAP family P-loop domain-containing protein [Granulicatella balaenopterae]
MSNKNEENSSEEHNKIESYFTKKHKVYPLAQTLKLVVVITAIALFIDIQNYPSILIDKFEVTTFGLAIVTVFVIISITAYEDGLHKQLTLPFINRLDYLMAICGEAGLLYLFSSWLIEVIGITYNESDSWSNELLAWDYKSWIALVVCAISFIILKKRYSIITINEQKQQSTNQNKIVYDFEKVYSGGLSIPKGQRFIISDEEAPNDLFGRARLINHLESLIASGSANDGCVISLQGKWGAGKTTLVNNVKEKVMESHDESDEKIIWIDEFDPWNYKDEEALVTSLLDAIIKRTGIHYQSSYFNKAASTLAKLILKTDSNAIDDIFRKDITLKEFKKRINDCLKDSNKKVVMVIDNLDRIDEEKLILIFDVIGNHLKFDNVTYLLLFDHERVGDVFESRPHLGYEYVNKIITIPITLPKLDNTKAKEVYGTALDNIFKAYNLDENIGEYDALLDTMLTL